MTAKREHEHIVRMSPFLSHADLLGRGFVLGHANPFHASLNPATTLHTFFGGSMRWGLDVGVK